MPDGPSFADGWMPTKPALRAAGAGLVVAQNRKAAAVGAAVLGAGGTAADAAVAASLALGAVEPWMSGLGGCGCLLAWPADAAGPTAVDFGTVAPAALDPRDYPLEPGRAAGDLFGWPAVRGDRNVRGPFAVAVPTLAAGLGLAHARWGRMPWAELAAPAAALARAGLEVDWFAALVIGAHARELRDAGGDAAAAAFLPDGLPPPAPAAAAEPARLALGRLADTLATLAAEGPAALGRGDVGRALAADVAAAGGPLRAGDLAAFEARAAAPLEFRYRDGRAFAMPGPFAGAALGRCLELLAPADLGPTPGAAAYLAYAGALRQAYAERLDGAGEGAAAGSGVAAGCTSHLAAADREGNLVALTQTLLSPFGSKVVSPSTGLLLNNGVMWFDPRPGRPNSMAPGRRPLANMCPVLGERPGAAAAGGGAAAAGRFALGASGGRRILPAVLQLLSFLIDHRLDLGAAMARPRIDASGPDGPVLAHPGLPAEVRAALAARHGAREVPPAPYPQPYACPSGLLLEPGAGGRVAHGAAEPAQPWAGPVVERAAAAAG